MISKEFNSMEELQPYYNKKFNTYIFKEDNEYIELVIFNFDLSIESNIYANDIDARDINARYINARYINANNIDVKKIYANNIDARDINYFEFCIAYNIFCKTIKGKRENSLLYYGKLTIKND